MIHILIRKLWEMTKINSLQYFSRKQPHLIYKRKKVKHILFILLLFQSTGFVTGIVFPGQDIWVSQTSRQVTESSSSNKFSTD